MQVYSLDDKDDFTISGAHVPRTWYGQVICQLLPAELEVSRHPLPPPLEAKTGGDHPLPTRLRSLVYRCMIDENDTEDGREDHFLQMEWFLASREITT